MVRAATSTGTVTARSTRLPAHRKLPPSAPVRRPLASRREGGERPPDAKRRSRGTMGAPPCSGPTALCRTGTGREQMSNDDVSAFREDDSWFSPAQLAQFAPADEADTFRSPIPTQMVSNGEYMPYPQTDKQRRVEAR